MRKHAVRNRSIIVIVFGLIAFLSYEWSVLVPKANAIPAFARKYNFACNVCHVPGFPKLNDFGNLFRDHGFQLGSDNDLPEYEGITMGYWPVSLRSTVGYRTMTYSQNGSGGSGTNGGGDVTTGGFGFRTLQFLSYGILAKNVSYGIQYAPQLASANFNTQQSGGDLPLAFVRLNTLERFLGVKGQDSYLVNMKIGKYEPELPFSSFRNPTQINTPIVIYNYRAGSAYASANFPSNSRVNATAYSNNTLSSLQRGAPGVEFAGIKPTDSTDGYFRYSLNAFSNSQANNLGGRGFYFYGHATQSFGGYGIVSGHRLGLSGWYGDAPTEANPLSTTTGTAGGGQKFYRVSLDASTTYGGEWNLFGAVIHAQDGKELMPTTGTNATTVANRRDARWNGGFVELDWYPNELPYFGTPGWLFLYRYDLVRNEQQGNRAVQGDYGNVDSHVWMSRYYFHFSSRTDIAWHTEFNWFRTRATGNNGQDTIGQMFFSGFDFAL